MLATVIAWSFREVRIGGEWTPFTLTPEDVAGIDAFDVNALQDLVLRERTPAQVTERSRAILGLPPDSSDDAEVAIPGWAGFRGEPGVPPVGDDGGTMGAPPEPAPVREG